MARDTNYIPALHFRQLTTLYDPLLRWGMREQTFKNRLIKEARIAPNARVLDLGCGTGTLTILLKQKQPTADVIGLDGDSQVLDIARGKAVQQKVNLVFEEGMAYQLPYPTDFFDDVVSSLVLHHLATQDRQRALAEAFRVLKRGGELWIIDFGKPQNPIAFLISLVMRKFERTRDLIEGKLPEQIQRANFADITQVASFSTIFGTIVLYQACKVSA